MTDDEWVSVEDIYTGPTPISVYATKREREEFGPQSNERPLDTLIEEGWERIK